MQETSHCYCTFVQKKNNASNQGFGDWVCEAIAGGANKAHRYTTKDAALPSLPMYESIGDQIVSDPILLIQERARRWMVLWSKHIEQFEQLNETISKVVRLARCGEDLPEVNALDLVRVIKSIKKDTALGPDHLSPRHLRRLP